MSVWLDDLNIQLEKLKIKELIRPQFDVCECDHVVGQASDELKKLFGLSMILKKRVRELAIQMDYSNSVEEKKKLEIEIMALAQKSEMLERIFWVQVRDEFELWDKSCVGIRRGWEIVWDEHSHPSLPDFLRSLFGNPFGPEPDGGG